MRFSHPVRRGEIKLLWLNPGKYVSRNVANLMSISEIIETLGDGDRETEVCATAETQYDSSTQKISVTLDSFARCVAASGNREHQTQPWLPPAEHVTEHLARDEAEAFTKDVFHSWVRKVRAAIPDELISTI